MVGGPLLDPYNVFHVENIRYNGIENNVHYIKMSYILKNPDKFDSFLFGASKVGAIHAEKIEGEKCYNMTYPGGVPDEHLANIRTFLENGIHPKKIYLGVDCTSYSTSQGFDPRTHINEQIRCPYEYLKAHPLHFYALYLNPSVILRSLYYYKYWGRNNDDAASKFYQYGAYYPYGTKSLTKLERSVLKPVKNQHITKNNPLFYEELKAIRAIVEICRAENIKLVVFINPTYHTLYIDALSGGYTIFFKELAEITEFYNFDGMNDVTMNDDSFINLPHYKPEVGDMILEVICKGVKYDGLYEQGFGWKVDKNNIQEFLKLTEISGVEI